MMERTPATRTRRRRHAVWVVRGALVLLAACVVAAAGGLLFERLSARGDAARYPPPGQRLDVSGSALHLYCEGQGSPTVVLAAGAGAFSLDWAAVQPELAKTTRACAFDRAGLGWSDPGLGRRTPEQIADDLARVLTRAGVTGPLVLVGHSIGGKHVRLYADKHPDGVAGMVLVDARHEYVDTHWPSERIAAGDAESRRFQQMLRRLAPFGLVRLLWAPAWPHFLPGAENLPPAVRTEIGVLQARPSQIDAVERENRYATASNARLEAAAPLGDVPLVVLAASHSTDGDPVWRAAQEIQARLALHGRLQVVPGGHALHFEQPDVVIDTVREVIEAARAAPRLGSPPPVPPGAVGAMSVAGLQDPLLVHWFEGRAKGLLVVRDPVGAAVATWLPPPGAEIRHLAEAVSPDGRHLTWLSGKRPDLNAATLDPTLTLHVQDLWTGEERFSQALWHPGMLDELRRQVLTVEGWGEDPIVQDWTPSWIRHGEGPPYGTTDWYTGVIELVFNDGIGRAAWSPDGSRLALIAALDGPTNDVYILEVPSFALHRLTREPEHVTRIDWSPDGTKLIYAAGLEPRFIHFDYRAMYLADVTTAAIRRFPPAEEHPRAPDGPMTTMIGSSDDGNTGDAWPLGWTTEGQVITNPPWYGTGYGSLTLSDAATGKQIEVMDSPDPPSDNALNVTMPSGDWAAVSIKTQSKEGTRPAGTYLVNLRDGSVERVDAIPYYLRYWGQPDLPFLMTRPIEPEDGRSALRSPVGQVQATATPTAFGPGGRRLRIADFPPAQWAAVAVAPGGRWRLACGDRACKVYGDGPRPVGGWDSLPVPDTSRMVFAPDDGHLAFLSKAGDLYLVHLPDGAPRRLGPWVGSWYQSDDDDLPSSWFPELALADGLGWLRPAATR